MKNFKLTLTNRRIFDDKLNKLQGLNPSKPLFVTVSDKSPSKRSLSANGQQHLWYSQIADYYGDRTALQVKNMCKDLIGLPILLQSESYGETIEFLLNKLDYYKHSYESKMKLIQCLSVTSEFKAKESKQYMDNMIFYFNDLGVPIRYKDDEK